MASFRIRLFSPHLHCADIFKMRWISSSCGGKYKQEAYKSANDTTKQKTVLEKLNNLSAQELSKFKTFGIDKAQRLVSYREEKGMLTSFQDLKDINGFTDALINSIEREGLMLKKKQGYNNLLDASTAKKIGSLTAIAITSNEVCWCSISKDCKVTDWRYQEFKREKKYIPEKFILKVKKIFDMISSTDIRIIELQTHKSASKDPFVFPYILHNRLTEAVMHSLSNVQTISFDPNLVKRHFQLPKGFNKQYYAVPLVNEILEEEMKRKEKQSAEDLEANFDSINATSGGEEVVELIIASETHKLNRSFRKKELLNDLEIPEHLCELYRNKQNREGQSNALLMALTFLDLEIHDRK